MTHPRQTPPMLRVRDIVAAGYPKTTVYRWLNETDRENKPFLPSYRIGGSVRIHRADWEAFVRAHVYRGDGR